METHIKSLETFAKRLQKEAAEFITSSKLVLNGIVIQPTEIEVYYYQEEEFADTSVHQNELQQNNAHHFYIHRKGINASDSYKGWNRAGIDFVLSNKKEKYYTYLIRSAIINDHLVVGPHNVLVALLETTHLSPKDLEHTSVKIVENKVSGEVLFSKRINLGKNAGDFCDLELRAVLCDDKWFKKSTYKVKPQMIIEYIKNQNMTKDQAFEYGSKKLAYRSFCRLKNSKCVSIGHFAGW